MRTLECYGGEVLLEFNEARHTYTANGDWVPSVTGICGILHKPLETWAATEARDYIRDNPDGLEYDELLEKAPLAWRRRRDKAADIGTQVHAFAQSVLTNDRAELPADPNARTGSTAFLNWLHANEVQPLFVERMIYSRARRYAGTTDFIGRINGERCVLDFKTSKHFVTPYTNMLYQLAGYAIAIEEEGSVDRIGTGYIIRLDKNTGLPDVHKGAIADHHREAFCKLREAFDPHKETERENYERWKQATR